MIQVIRPFLALSSPSLESTAGTTKPWTYPRHVLRQLDKRRWRLTIDKILVDVGDLGDELLEVDAQALTRVPLLHADPGVRVEGGETARAAHSEGSIDRVP